MCQHPPSLSLAHKILPSRLHAPRCYVTSSADELAQWKSINFPDWPVTPATTTWFEVPWGKLEAPLADGEIQATIISRQLNPGSTGQFVIRCMMLDKGGHGDGGWVVEG